MTWLINGLDGSITIVSGILISTSLLPSFLFLFLALNPSCILFKCKRFEVHLMSNLYIVTKSVNVHLFCLGSQSVNVSTSTGSNSNTYVNTGQLSNSISSMNPSYTKILIVVLVMLASLMYIWHPRERFSWTGSSTNILISNFFFFFHII